MSIKSIPLYVLDNLMDTIIDKSLELPDGLRPTREELAVMVFFAHKIMDEAERL